MVGVIVNACVIAVGGVLGMLFGHALPERIKQTIIQGIGLAVILIGVHMAIQTNNSLVVIGSLVTGGIIGEWINIEGKLEYLGQWLEAKAARGSQSGGFTKAFMTTSLIYCVGAMAIMGSLESGLKGNNDILYAKAAIDGISAIIFASSMGGGVIVSAVPVFIYQGAITLSAGSIQGLLPGPVLTEMSATGGLLILGIGLAILEIKDVKVGNLLPAIFTAIPLTWLATYFGK